MTREKKRFDVCFDGQIERDYRRRHRHSFLACMQAETCSCGFRFEVSIFET
jgi:hypothetical protein